MTLIKINFRNYIKYFTNNPTLSFAIQAQSDLDDRHWDLIPHIYWIHTEYRKEFTPTSSVAIKFSI